MAEPTPQEQERARVLCACTWCQQGEIRCPRADRFAAAIIEQQEPLETAVRDMVACWPVRSAMHEQRVVAALVAIRSGGDAGGE